MMLFCCMDCDKGFNHLWELSSHVMTVHSNEGSIWHCTICSGSFTSRTIYNIHQTTNHSVKDSECNKEANIFIDQVRTTNEVDFKQQSIAPDGEEKQLPDLKPILNIEKNARGTAKLKAKLYVRIQSLSPTMRIELNTKTKTTGS